MRDNVHCLWLFICAKDIFMPHRTQYSDGKNKQGHSGNKYLYGLRHRVSVFGGGKKRGLLFWLYSLLSGVSCLGLSLSHDPVSFISREPSRSLKSQCQGETLTLGKRC